ncbi:hypothetical protein [Nocardia farcinica]|uniref:hypothetical protein n=1 Tax=Nocardia farcinica TaxID=37329 RepID=UPI002454403D|nr:hypothetical protein [Nocardia farcinica]
MARTQEWQDSEPWPQAWPDEHEPDDPFPPEPRPMVNPYAVIALVAALLALFPVAIVFGLIAFGHPRGRAMATFAVLLGLAEVATLAALVLMSGNLLSDGLTRADDLVAPQSTAGSTAAPPTTTPTPPPASTAPTALPTAEAPVVRKGAACTAAQLGMIGSAADGGTLLCLGDPATEGVYRWSGPYHVGTGVYEPGETCDPGIAKSGRTADGRALVCEGGARDAAWVRWTE